MKKCFALSVFGLFLVIFGWSQPQNSIVQDEVTGDEILLGYGNRDGMLLQPFSDWFNAEYEDYAIDRETIRQIDPASLNDLSITILLGTWCPDSRKEVPRFYRILDEMGFNEARLEVIYLDRDKKAPGINLEAYNLHFVPTFVFYRNGEEAGRITEYPLESLEKDMYSILSGV